MFFQASVRVKDTKTSSLRSTALRINPTEVFLILQGKYQLGGDRSIGAYWIRFESIVIGIMLNGSSTAISYLFRSGSFLTCEIYRIQKLFPKNLLLKSSFLQFSSSLSVASLQSLISSLTNDESNHFIPNERSLRRRHKIGFDMPQATKLNASFCTFDTIPNRNSMPTGARILGSSLLYIMDLRFESLLYPFSWIFAHINKFGFWRTFFRMVVILPACSLW